MTQSPQKILHGLGFYSISSPNLTNGNLLCAMYTLIIVFIFWTFLYFRIGLHSIRISLNKCLKNATQVQLKNKHPLSIILCSFSFSLLSVCPSRYIVLMFPEMNLSLRKFVSCKNTKWPDETSFMTAAHMIQKSEYYRY